ncbi:hypothetical protein ACHQM5_002853 [Ranunculus cassubicifolius]
MKIKSLFFIFLILAITSVQSRFITTTTSTNLISDGSEINSDQFHPIIRFKQSATEMCEQTYGFLPCTETALGNFFLIAVYGFLMFMAARYLSSGSEMLLEILGPGIIGGLFLPVLGALPDALLILVSGLSGNKETAQDQVLVGMGLLAGSTVMLLTLLWGSCVILGKTDIEGQKTIDLQDTKGFSLTGSGISTDIWTSYAAMIMVISLIPFIIVQIPQIIHTSSGRRLTVLIALIASIALLVSYCLYQVFQPWIQERKLKYVRLKHVMSGVLGQLKKRSLGKLYKDDGKPNADVIKKLFKAIDLDDSGHLSKQELRALIIGINFEKIDFDHDDAAREIMADFDISRDDYVDENEFVIGISKWLNEAKRSTKHKSGSSTLKIIHGFHQQTSDEHDLIKGTHGDEESSDVDNPKWVSFKAVLLLLLGAVIAAAFADPLVDAVDNFSTATRIPSFFISFIILPLATNSSEAVSALIFACRKKTNTSSLTFSEIYGAVTMNNVLCLAVFLAIVYIRELTWDFSAEVLVILIVCVVMGVFASFRTVFPIWTSSVAFLLYPFSLALVYLLDYVFGWS